MTNGKVWAESSFLRFPLTDTLPVAGGGLHNDFQGGSIYWHPSLGAHEVHGAIQDKWFSLSPELKNILGYLVTDEEKTPDQIGRYNHFQGGSIYWHPSLGAHEVHGAVRDKWANMNWEKGPLGYPISDLVNKRQNFQGGYIELYRGTPTSHCNYYETGCDIGISHPPSPQECIRRRIYCERQCKHWDEWTDIYANCMRDCEDLFKICCPSC
ncbi:hypothetical protein GK047_12870 [Paenibacillus sp. SYP-B3998]|uniref:Uncharacterized protein n=1 Tax=Paenibacillus sp. SYP-B3998 TaxID=2678564 RepID=A0A6G3ZXQ8_9BACL|nr:hypothetical protein [Paenibacillus sp. SYP-B3998]